MKKSLALACMLACIAFLAACNLNRGSGEKVGTIVKFAQEGLLCTTTEIEVIKGGMNGGSGAFGVAPLDATIKDPVLAAKAEKYFNSQTEVRIKYSLVTMTTPCSTEQRGHAHFVTAIDPIGEPPAAE